MLAINLKNQTEWNKYYYSVATYGKDTFLRIFFQETEREGKREKEMNSGGLKALKRIPTC